MRLKEDIKPVTFMKQQSAELIRQVTESSRPVIITQSGEARVVVLDVRTYEALQDAALFMKATSHGEADIKAGRLTPQSEVFARIRQRLDARDERPRRQKPASRGKRSGVASSK